MPKGTGAAGKRLPLATAPAPEGRGRKEGGEGGERSRGEEGELAAESSRLAGVPNGRMRAAQWGSIHRRGQTAKAERRREAGEEKERGELAAEFAAAEAGGKGDDAPARRTGPRRGREEREDQPGAPGDDDDGEQQERG